MPAERRIPSWLLLIAVAAILSGVFFRLYNIDRKVYWYDEAITSHLMSGYANWELIDAVRGHMVPVREFGAYYRPTSSREVADTVKVAMSEDMHPPLYYTLARIWAGYVRQWTDNTILALRGLSAVFSLAAFPLVFWLAMELFKSRQTAAVAVALYAVSPFHVLYAQEARVYAFWTLSILLSSVLVLRAKRKNSAPSWALYSASMILALYTHLFSIFLVAAHGMFIFASEGLKPTAKARNFTVAAAAALLAISPWLRYLLENPGLMSGVNAWIAAPAGMLTWLAGWGTGLTSIVFDVNFRDFWLGYVLPPALAVIALIAYSLWHLAAKAPADARLLLSSLIASNAAPLLIPDLLFGGVRSSVPRYMLPMYLCIGMSLAYLLSSQITEGKKSKGPAVLLAAVLTLGVVSCAVSSQATLWWDKYLTDDFPQIAASLNAADRPLLVSDDSTCQIYSLSSRLDDKASIMLLDGTRPPVIPKGMRDVFLYKPSEKLKDTLEKDHTIEPVPGCFGLSRLREKG